jgi:hypothetical protein
VNLNGVVDGDITLGLFEVVKHQKLQELVEENILSIHLNSGY